jgi:hypothetical protein
MFLNNQWQLLEGALEAGDTAAAQRPLSLSVRRASHAMSLKAWHS